MRPSGIGQMQLLHAKIICQTKMNGNFALVQVHAGPAFLEKLFPEIFPACTCFDSRGMQHEHVQERAHDWNQIKFRCQSSLPIARSEFRGEYFDASFLSKN